MTFMRASLGIASYLSTTVGMQRMEGEEVVLR